MSNDLYLQKEYIQKVSSHLDNFKQKNDLFNFRCNICGDSVHNKNKSRAYFYKKDETYNFICHNCNESMSFIKFLYLNYNDIYMEYRNESLKQKFKNKQTTQQTKLIKSIKSSHWHMPTSTEYKTINELGSEHIGWKYLLLRNIPVECFDKVKWCDNFKKLAMAIDKNKYNDLLESSGLLFELYDKNNNLVGYQQRHINPNISKKNRFLIASGTDSEKGYFKHKYIQHNKPLFIVEGCIDSLLIENSIATINSSISSIEYKDAIYFNDQEPFNKEIIKEMKKIIDKNYKIVLLPKKYHNMDINDIWNIGIRNIEEFLLNYTYSGLQARIKFLEWIKK